MSDDSWVVWSEEHGRWWKPGECGYTDSLREAGRYSETRAKEIEARANIPCKSGEFNEIALPDPMPDARDARPET